MPRPINPNKPKRKPHRPKIPIDWKKVDDLLLADCDGASIARRFGIHPHTLYERCEIEKGMSLTLYKMQKKAIGDDMIRQVQFAKALKGDNVQLVWLGKNRLGQTDKNESKLDIKQEVTQKALLELPDNDNR